MGVLSLKMIPYYIFFTYFLNKTYIILIPEWAQIPQFRLFFILYRFVVLDIGLMVFETKQRICLKKKDLKT